MALSTPGNDGIGRGGVGKDGGREGRREGGGREGGRDGGREGGGMKEGVGKRLGVGSFACRKKVLNSAILIAYEVKT